MKIQADLQQLRQRNVRLGAILSLERSFFFLLLEKKRETSEAVKNSWDYILITGSENTETKAMETLLVYDKSVPLKSMGIAPQRRTFTTMKSQPQ